jgi:hypothetical protein
VAVATAAPPPSLPVMEAVQAPVSAVRSEQSWGSEEGSEGAANSSGQEVRRMRAVCVCV